MPEGKSSEKSDVVPSTIASTKRKMDNENLSELQNKSKKHICWIQKTPVDLEHRTSHHLKSRGGRDQKRAVERYDSKQPGEPGGMPRRVRRVQSLEATPT